MLYYLFKRQSTPVLWSYEKYYGYYVCKDTKNKVKAISIQDQSKFPVGFATFSSFSLFKKILVTSKSLQPNIFYHPEVSAKENQLKTLSLGCTFLFKILIGCFKTFASCLKVSKSQKNIWCSQFFQRTNARIILSSENYNSVHFLEESRTP